MGGGSERSSGGGRASKAECEKLVAGWSRVAGISLLTRTRTRVTRTREPVRVAKPVQIPIRAQVRSHDPIFGVSGGDRRRPH